MKKDFQIGLPLESNTEYLATQREYHVYLDDTAEICDDRYVALRANDTKLFRVFLLIKNKKNITIDFQGATLVLHGKIQPFLIDSSENVTIKNCNVTFHRPHYTEALITQVTPEYARLRLNKFCTCRVEDGKLIPYGDGWENGRLNYNYCFYQVFDAETRKGCGIELGVMGNQIFKEPEYPFTPKLHFTAK